MSPVLFDSGSSGISSVTTPAARSSSVNRHRLTPHALEEKSAKLVSP
jgi:hypothetical protein